jgi:hypothetical protein
MSKALRLSTLILSAAVLARPAMAQTDKLAQIAALPLSEMCSADGALGKKFGATDLMPSSHANPGIASKPLEVLYAPFVSFDFFTTRYSNKMFGVVFESRFEDEKNTEDAIKAIAARFVANGWKTVKVDYETFDINLSLNTENSANGAGVRVILQPLNGGVVLTCQNDALAEQSDAEERGEYPADLPRPARPIPDTVSIDRLAPVNCNDPETNMLSTKAFKYGDWKPRIKVEEERDYQQRLIAWKVSQLVASAIVDRQTLNENMMQLLETSGVNETWLKSYDNASNLLSEIEKIEKIEKAGNLIQFCIGIEKLKMQIGGIAKIAWDNDQVKWAVLHTFLDTEAMRLGVTYAEQ